VSVYILSICLLLSICFNQEIEGTLTIDGLQRTYHASIPEVNTPDEKLPMVIILHGGGGTGSQVAHHTHFTDLAEQERFIAVYPNGLNGGWNDHRIGTKLSGEQDQTLGDGNCCWDQRKILAYLVEHS